MTEAYARISEEDRTLAMLTHLSGLAGYVIPLGGVLVPVVIWCVKSENEVIAAIAKQALFLNAAVFLAGVAFWVLALTVVLIPVSILGWILIGLLAVVFPIVGAVKASDGQFFSYPLIGSRI